jgi:hypothetical protein
LESHITIIYINQRARGNLRRQKKQRKLENLRKQRRQSKIHFIIKSYFKLELF